MADIETEVLRHEVRIDARPETVFSYLMDPARIVQWKGRSATLDPRPGGVYRVEINDVAVARGEYVEVEPPSRVVFTWGCDHSSKEGEMAHPALRGDWEGRLATAVLLRGL